MDLRRIGLICSITANGIALLLATLIAVESTRRDAGIMFVLIASAALIISIVLIRRLAPTSRRPSWFFVLLGLPPLVIVASLNESLPLWWPGWAGGPVLSATISEGPLSTDEREIFHLPPHRAEVLGRDGMSVSIRPTFGVVDYDLDLAPGGLVLPGRPTARLWVRPKGRPTREYRFHVPWEDLQVTLQAFDARALRWRGQLGMSTDGTSILVERVKEDVVSSIYTNASTSSEPGNPAAQLRTDLHALMLAYGPTGSIPRSYDWHVHLPEDELTCCVEGGLNSPTPQGANRQAAGNTNR